MIGIGLFLMMLMNGRHLVEERGLAFMEVDSEQIRHVLASIEPLHWSKFVQNPGPVVSVLVREFYSNMDITTNTSTVRGHTIFFAARVINRLYETPDLDDTHLHTLLRNPTWDEIGPDLCPLGIQWHVDSHGQRDSFPARNVSLVAKVWMLCLSSRLEPNRNTYEIRPRRARWLYAIMKRYPINVGRIICETMKRGRTKKSVKSLYFGSTITQLINIFGNPPGPDFGFVLPSNIGMSTLRALGPCVGPNNGAGRRQPGREEFASYFDRLEERMENIYNQQQQMRDEFAALRAIQTEQLFHTTIFLQNFGNMINTVIAILQLTNVPAIPPFAFQNMDFNFPAGHTNFQPPLQGHHTLHGGIVAENVPHTGIEGNHAFAPRGFNPEFADIEMNLEELIGMSEAGANSGNAASCSTNKE